MVFFLFSDGCRIRERGYGITKIGLVYHQPVIGDDDAQAKDKPQPAAQSSKASGQGSQPVAKEKQEKRQDIQHHGGFQHRGGGDR